MPSSRCVVDVISKLRHCGQSPSSTLMSSVTSSGHGYPRGTGNLFSVVAPITAGRSAASQLLSFLRASTRPHPRIFSTQKRESRAHTTFPKAVSWKTRDTCSAKRSFTFRFHRISYPHFRRSSQITWTLSGAPITWSSFLRRVCHTREEWPGSTQHPS